MIEIIVVEMNDNYFDSLASRIDPRSLLRKQLRSVSVLFDRNGGNLASSEIPSRYETHRMRRTFPPAFRASEMDVKCRDIPGDGRLYLNPTLCVRLHHASPVSPSSD